MSRRDICSCVCGIQTQKIYFPNPNRGVFVLKTNHTKAKHCHNKKKERKTLLSLNTMEELHVNVFLWYAQTTQHLSFQDGG